MGGDAEVDDFGIFRLAGVVEHAFVVGIDAGFVEVGSLRPVVEFGIDFFHGEIGSFDEADFDGRASFFDTGTRPVGEFDLDGMGVGEVGLEDDAGAEVEELGFIEDGFKNVEGEVEVAVFLHVEVDEGGGGLFLRGAVELAESLGEDFFGVVVGGEVDLGENGGEFDGDVVGGVGGEGVDVLLETFLSFFFTEDGFAKEVEVDGGSLFFAEVEVFFERLGFGGEDDFF